MPQVSRSPQRSRARHRWGVRATGWRRTPAADCRPSSTWPDTAGRRPPGPGRARDGWFARFLSGGSPTPELRARLATGCRRRGIGAWGRSARRTRSSAGYRRGRRGAHLLFPEQTRPEAAVVQRSSRSPYSPASKPSATQDGARVARCITQKSRWHMLTWGFRGHDRPTGLGCGATRSGGVTGGDGPVTRSAQHPEGEQLPGHTAHGSRRHRRRRPGLRAVPSRGFPVQPRPGHADLSTTRSSRRIGAAGPRRHLPGAAPDRPRPAAARRARSALHVRRRRPTGPAQPRAS